MNGNIIDFMLKFFFGKKPNLHPRVVCVYDVKYLIIGVGVK